MMSGENLRHSPALPEVPIKVLAVAGTRPEAIKLAPVVQTLRTRPEFVSQFCFTGQHRELADNILPLFGLSADFALDTMRPGQTLCSLTARILEGLQDVLASVRPELMLVQGDTTSTLCGALAGFYHGIPVAHIEAGLRTGDLNSPFPEEANRRMVTQIAKYHFPATNEAANHLRREGVAESRMWVTGNTGIDAVLRMRSGIANLPVAIDPARKLILVTAHRRENLQSGLAEIARGVRHIADRTDVQIVFPVHPNPQVQAAAYALLSGHPRIHLTEALPYEIFVELMRRSHLILSDSGGIQEEAPALGKPVLILRDTTERPEAVAAGANRVIGACAEAIARQVTELLDNRGTYAKMARVRNVYGDGRASERICRALLAAEYGVDDTVLVRDTQAA